MTPAGFYGLYGSSKPPLRDRVADKAHQAADFIWAWGTLSQPRQVTEVDVALIRFCAALDRLAEAIR